MKGLKGIWKEEAEWAEAKKPEGPDGGCMLGYMDGVEILHQEQQQVGMEREPVHSVKGAGIKYSLLRREEEMWADSQFEVCEG